MKEDYQKALKKLISFFLSNPVPFNGQSYLKQKGSRTSDQSLFRLQNVQKKVQKNSFISYILSEQVWWDNMKRFFSYFKNRICKFMQANSWHLKLCQFRLSFWVWRVWKGRGKKCEYLQYKKSFLDEIKNIFHSFWRAIIWWKNKKLIKNSGHKL